MTLDPLLHAAPAIQIHAFSAISALVLGAFVLWHRKGTALHRALGRIWIALMLVTATSALFINELRLIGPFGPIHLFSLFTYTSIAQGLYAIIIRRDVARHRREMQGLYFGALVLAGTFTLLPGRRLNHVLFGPEAGWAPAFAVIAAVLLISALVWRRMRPAHGR